MRIQTTDQWCQIHAERIRKIPEQCLGNYRRPPAESPKPTRIQKAPIKRCWTTKQPKCNVLKIQLHAENAQLKVTPNLRGATFTEIIFLDHIKVNYLNYHFPKKLT